MTVKCPICGGLFTDGNKLALHTIWKHQGGNEAVRKKLSEKAKLRLAKLSKEERRLYVLRSALTVPRWNKGKPLPDWFKQKVLAGLEKARKAPRKYPSRQKLIINKCKVCGKEFTTTKKRKRIYCSRKCAKADPELRKRLSESVKKLYQNPEYFKKYMEGRQKMKANPNWRKNVSLGVKRWFEEHPYEREILAQKCIKQMNLKPNHFELSFYDFLQAHFGNRFQYTGDGYTFIGRHNPDFVDFERKIVIELFGDYWHEPSEEIERIQYYKTKGWNAIVIWESEFRQNPKAVLERIKNVSGTMS